ncbi:MAG: patatin-like phospholipase family protein, partial [Solirubrobacteraceae bacterium]
MGNVVKLEASAKARSKQRTRTRASASKGSKTALVLGGGGFTGGVYEIGALRALDLLSVNRTVNEFDVYVGTSAGSFIAALAANGITPEEMMRVVIGQTPTPFRDIDIGTLLRPNLLDFARKCAMMPLKAALLARQLAGHVGQGSVMD